MNRNRFDFLHIIGKGGFGKVWKVVDKKYKISYALKEMSKVKVIDKKSINSIKYERELLSRLHHPLIVNLHYAFQDFENLYLILDLLPGGDLRFHITRHKKRFFTEIQTKFFICCIILALKYIHSNKIIHRDIKPENLVFDLKGFLHITDFGIAKFFSTNNSKETSGTPGYMAPEVMKGKNHTYAVDYFAVGVIAYELMMGRRPYVGKSKKEIREQIMSKQVFVGKDEIPLGWSDDAAEFINRCLERKDVKRIGFENENEVFGHSWFKDVDWKGIERKKVFCPFEIDSSKENYDKKYCEGVDKIGVNTNARYEDYKNNEKYNDLFHDFTFVNINLEIKLNKNENKNNNNNNIAIDSHRFKIQKSYSNNNMLERNKNNNNNNNINYNNLILTHRHNVSNINREHKIRIPSANNVQRHQHYNSLNLNNNNNNLNKRQLLLDNKITDNNKYLSHHQNYFSPIPKSKSKNINIIRKNNNSYYSNEKINVNGNYYLSNNNNNNDITPLNKNNQTKIPISVRKLMRSNSHSNIYISNSNNNTINYKNNNNNMNINNNNNYKPNKFIKNNNNNNNSNSNTINHKIRRKNIPNRPPISYREALRNINYNSLNNIKNNNNNNNKNINMLNNYMINKNNIENNIFYNKNNSSNSFNYNNNNNNNKIKRKEFSINYANSQRHYYYHQDNNKSNNYYNNNYNKTYGFNMKKTSPFHSNYSTNATSTKKNYN